MHTQTHKYYLFMIPMQFMNRTPFQIDNLLLQKMHKVPPYCPIHSVYHTLPLSNQHQEKRSNRPVDSLYGTRCLSRIDKKRLTSIHKRSWVSEHFISKAGCLNLLFGRFDMLKLIALWIMCETVESAVVSFSDGSTLNVPHWTADFGAQPSSYNVEGPLAVANDTNSRFCNASINVAGSIVLARAVCCHSTADPIGDCWYEVRGVLGQSMNALGVMIANCDSAGDGITLPMEMGECYCYPPDATIITIPVVSISCEDFNRILGASSVSLSSVGDIGNYGLVSYTSLPEWVILAWVFGAICVVVVFVLAFRLGSIFRQRTPTVPVPVTPAVDFSITEITETR